MDEIIKVNFDELDDDKLHYFQNEFIKIFEEVKKQIDEIEEQRRNDIGKERKVDDLKVTKFGKIALLAKKVFVNTAISHFTGIDPVYLDNDSEFLRLTDLQKLGYYRRCDTSALAYSISKDLKNAMEVFVNKLKTDNREELIKLLKNVDEAHMVTYELLNQNVKAFEALLYPIMMRDGIFTYNNFAKIQALSDRGFYVGLSYNFIKDLDNVYKNYVNNYGVSKTR